MAITNDHVTGFLVGMGAAAAGFYLYRRNQAQVDAWLRNQGIQVGSGGERDPATMSLEDLVSEKERLEDVIAEREMAAQEEPRPEAPAPEGA
jgi:hypothetical protein